MSSAKPPTLPRHRSSAPAPNATGLPRSCGSTPRSAWTSSASGQVAECSSTTTSAGGDSGGSTGPGCAQATLLIINRRGRATRTRRSLHRAGTFLTPFVALHADDVVGLLLVLFALEPHRR